MWVQLRHVGAIHGRLLTAWSAAAVLGPRLLTYLHKTSYNESATQLSNLVDPSSFQSKFGMAPEPVNVKELIDANTVTIARLLEIVPEGTRDPTPLLYNSGFQTISVFALLAFVSNALIKIPYERKEG